MKKKIEELFCGKVDEQPDSQLPETKETDSETIPEGDTAPPIQCLEDATVEDNHDISEDKNEETLSEKEVKTVSPQEDSVGLIVEKIKILAASIEDIRTHVLHENRELMSQLENKQLRIEQVIQNAQEDRYRKDRMKLINRCIYQTDIVRKSIADFSEMELSPEDSVAWLQEQLNAILIAMEATLEQEMLVRIQEGTNGADFHSDFQESIETVSTDKPELDGKIHASLNPGYIWTLPYILKAKIADNGEELKYYRFLLRPEQVITYKFSK